MGHNPFLRGSHIRYPAYQMFTLLFITVAVDSYVVATKIVI